MSAYLSDDEQAEALKKWLRENGKSLIGGTALGLALVFGWQSWMSHRMGVAAQASAQYEQLRNAMEAKQSDATVNLAGKIDAEHADSSYALFAALSLAKVQIAKGDLGAAKPLLEKAIAGAKEPGIQQMARHRLVRLMLAQNDLDGAERVLGQVGADAGPFAGDFAELRGDLAKARQKPDEARKAYREAVEKGAANSTLVQMKLDDLGEAPQGTGS